MKLQKLSPVCVALSSFVSGCGAVTDIITSPTPPSEECADVGTNLASNCQVGGPAPTPTPAPANVGLVFQGDVVTPPPSAYTLVGSVQVPQGTPSSWQQLGQNNQPTITKTVATTMQQVGDCRIVHVKVKVTNGGANSGTFLNPANPNKFKYCEEHGKISVEFEDGVDSLFNDYKVLIGTTNTQPLRYEVLGNGQLKVCLD
jgi:hypothetical protein